jgi:hypothetical protein
MSLLALTLALASFGTETQPPTLAFEPLVGPVPAATAPWAAALPAARDDGGTFSYSYIEAGATRLDLDAIDDDADTYYLRASFALFKFLYILGGYENQSTDFENADTDVWSLGFGAYFSVNPKLDIHGDVSWLYNDIDSDSFDDSSSGSLTRLAARWMPFDIGGGGGVELHGGALWVSADDTLLSDDSVLGLEIGARWHIVQAISVDLTYTSLEDDDQAGLSARFSF